MHEFIVGVSALLLLYFFHCAYRTAVEFEKGFDLKAIAYHFVNGITVFIGAVLTCGIIIIIAIGMGVYYGCCYLGEYLLKLFIYIKKTWLGF